MKLSRIALCTAVLMASVPLFAQNVDIDYRLDTTGSSKSYFNWTQGKKNVVKDSYDAASGASISGTTLKFNDVRFDAPKKNKATMSAGLRGLFLFPVAGDAQVTHDAFTVTKENGVITVHYVHRDSAYEI